MQRQSSSDSQNFVKDKQYHHNSFQRQKRKSNTNEQQHKISTRRRKSLKSERTTKSAQYHKSIAQQRRQQKINTSRQSTHISNMHVQMKKFSSKLNSKKKRYKFIKMILQRMEGNPNEEWRQVMRELLWAMKCLYMSKEMVRLIMGNNRVVDRLGLCFEERYSGQRLWAKAAYLLEKVVFLDPKALDHVLGMLIQGNKRHLVVIAYQLTLLFQDASLTEIGNCIQLITTIMSRRCKDVVSIIGLDRALMYAIKWLQMTMREGKAIDKPLSKVYRYLVYLSRQISQQWTKLQRQFRFIIKKLMETLNQVVQFHQELQNHQKIIIIISTLTQYTQKIKGQDISQQQQHRLAVNLPVCMIVASMSNLLNKVIDLTPNQLKQTAKMVIKMVEVSTEPHDEHFQLGEILKRYIIGQKRRRQSQKQNEIYDSSRTTTTRTIPVINNLISYLLVIYEQNDNTKQIITKIHSFFKVKTQEILRSQSQKPQENPNLDDTQSNLQNQLTTNEDVEI